MRIKSLMCELGLCAFIALISTSPVFAGDGNNDLALDDIQPGTTINIRNSLKLPPSGVGIYYLQFGKVYPLENSQKLNFWQPYCAIGVPTATPTPPLLPETRDLAGKSSVVSKVDPGPGDTWDPRTQTFRSRRVILRTRLGPDNALSDIECCNGGYEAEHLRVADLRAAFGWAVTVDEPEAKSAVLEKAASSDLNGALAALAPQPNGNPTEAQAAAKPNVPSEVPAGTPSAQPDATAQIAI